MATTIGSGTNGLEMNAEAVMGLFQFLDPTQKKNRIFTAEDLVKESEKLRGQARVQFTQTREQDRVQDETRNAQFERSFGRGPVVSSATPIDSGTAFRAHNLGGVMLR